MNNLPLQPLVWQDLDEDPMLAPVSISESPLHQYVILKDSDKVRVRYSERYNNFDYATGFATIDEAKAWSWKHYNEKMQPYVKPLPTWIDASERLPESECFYLVRLFDGHRDEHVFVILWWNSEHQQFLEWDAMCEPTHWMPIPEFSTMQNLHKGE